jgi:hypothetical protein
MVPSVNGEHAALPGAWHLPQRDWFWRWAACARLALQRLGLPADVEEIIHHARRPLVDKGGMVSEALASLDGLWTYGNRVFHVFSSFVPGRPTDQYLVSSIARQQALVVIYRPNPATLQVALLTDVLCEATGNGPAVSRIIVRDPVSVLNLGLVAHDAAWLSLIAGSWRMTVAPVWIPAPGGGPASEV